MPSFFQTGPRRFVVYDSSVFVFGMVVVNAIAPTGHAWTQACTPPGPPLAPRCGVSTHRSHFCDRPIAGFQLQTGRDERARADAHLAADAQVRVDHPHVAERRVRLVRPHRPHRTDLDARRVGALVALGHVDVVRPVRERILLDLDARQRVRRFTGVGERAHHHAGAAALALLHVDEQEALGVRYHEHVRRKDPVRAQRCSGADGARTDEKAAPGRFAGRRRRRAGVVPVANTLGEGSRIGSPSRVIVHVSTPRSIRGLQFAQENDRRTRAIRLSEQVRASESRLINDGRPIWANGIANRLIRCRDLVRTMRCGGMRRCRARLREPSPKPSPTSEAPTSDR